MQHRQERNQSGAEPAERGRGRSGKPAESGGGALSVEARLVELQTRVGALEAHAERSENRWEKWRSEDHRRHMESRKEQTELRKEQTELRKEQTELRKEQTELRKEMTAGFAELGKEMAAGFAELRKEVDASSRRADEKYMQFTEQLAAVNQATGQLAEKFIRRVELATAVILAAIFSTGIFG